MFKLLLAWLASRCGGAPRGREEMFKPSLLSFSLPAEKWRGSIIMKNAFILGCHSCFSATVENNAVEQCVCVCARVKWDRTRYTQQLTRPSNAENNRIKNQTALNVSSWELKWVMRKVELRATRRSVDDDWQAWLPSDSHAALRRLRASSSRSLTFSSLWLKWREACWALHKMPVWLLSSPSQQVNFWC